jgi:two-component system sensor histidine kinase/response regulator
MTTLKQHLLFLTPTPFWLVLLLCFFGNKLAAQQVEFPDNKCAEHEKHFRFKLAEECAYLAINQEDQEATTLVASFAVLARIRDEYYDFWAADSLYIRALSSFPERERKSAEYAEMLKETGLFHKTYIETQTSIMYLRQAEKIWKDPQTFASVQIPLATGYAIIGKHDSANFYLAKAKKLSEGKGDLMMARYYVEYARYFYHQSDYAKAVPQLVNALFHFKNLPDNVEKAQAFFLFGDAYAEAGNNARAINFYKESLRIFKTSNSPEQSNAMNTIGWVFYNSKQYDSAYVYLKASLAYHNEVAPNTILKSYSLGNLGLVYYALDSLEKAEAFSQAAMDLYREMSFTPGVAEAYNNLGGIYFKQNKLQESNDCYKTAYKLSTVDWPEAVELMNSAIGLSELAKLAGDFEKAYGLLETANNIKDSLSNIQLATELISVEINNSAEIAENRIHDLEIEQAEKNVALQKSQYALIALLITAFIVLISSVVISVSWKQRQTAIKKQSEILNINQEIIRMISHDFRGPMNNIRVLMELLRSDEMKREEFNEISEVIYNQTCEISLMFETFVGWALSQSDNYVPKTESTDWTDIVNGVVNLLDPLATIKNLKITIEKDGDHHLQTDRIAAQLVLRNLLSNAIKFSNEGEEINIRISKQNKTLITGIEDQGVGMDAERLNQLFRNDLESEEGTQNETGSGLGLKMALKFAELNGGRIDVKSKENVGSTFTYRLPTTPPSV